MTSSWRNPGLGPQGLVTPTASGGHAHHVVTPTARGGHAHHVVTPTAWWPRPLDTAFLRGLAPQVFLLAPWLPFFDSFAVPPVFPRPCLWRASGLQPWSLVFSSLSALPRKHHLPPRFKHSITSTLFSLPTPNISSSIHTCISSCLPDVNIRASHSYLKLNVSKTEWPSTFSPYLFRALPPPQKYTIPTYSLFGLSWRQLCPSDAQAKGPGSFLTAFVLAQLTSVHPRDPVRGVHPESAHLCPPLSSTLSAHLDSAIASYHISLLHPNLE